MSALRGTKRKNSSSSHKKSSSSHTEYKTIKLDCSDVDAKFLMDIKASLYKAETREACKYDCKGKQCYQTNPRHIASFSHKHHCGERDIALFKEDTDRFLKNTYAIYACNNYKDFSTKWYIEIGARRGAEGEQIYTAIYNEFHRLIFFILANVALHVEDYVQEYGKKFLLNMFQMFESSDNTGLFPIKEDPAISEIFKKYAPEEPSTKQIDYRLGNTTISDIIKNEKIPDKEEESIEGGRRKRITKKRRTNKRTTKKRRSKSNKRIKRK
jgi:hypothetical protein